MNEFVEFGTNSTDPVTSVPDVTRQSALAYRAAAIMAERGHCKNKLTDSEGRVCYLQALILAAEQMELPPSAIAEIPVLGMSRTILQERGYASIMPFGDSFLPVDYNNDPATSGEDVILLLKESGSRLEEQ